MRILITGNAGFIGSHVADFLCHHELLGIDNLSTGKYENTVSSNICFDTIDIQNYPELLATFKMFEPNICIHLAAQPSLIVSETNPILDAGTNIIGTINVISACKEVGCSRLIFASTSAVYNEKIRTTINENASLSPTTNYGTSKLCAEYYIKNSGLIHTILRLGNVYGERQVPLGENQLIPRVLSHIYNGTPFSVYGHGQDLRDYIYVYDVASAIEQIVGANYGYGGIYNNVFNLGTGIGSRTIDVVMQIMDLTGRNFDIIHTERRDKRNIVLNCDAFLKTGWKAQFTLKQGLERTIAAWKQ